jgi:hypothetical protein
MLVITSFFFLQKQDYTRKFGLSSIPKYTITIRMFAYETRVDVIDEYFQLAKNMVMEWMKQFGHIGKHYLYFYANIIKIGIRMIF